ncbi:hypothetical protein BH09SUM1_BH09SUM1_08400 [soil metagenome]
MRRVKKHELEEILYGFARHRIYTFMILWFALHTSLLAILTFGFPHPNRLWLPLSMVLSCVFPLFPIWLVVLPMLVIRRRMLRMGYARPSNELLRAMILKFGCKVMTISLPSHSMIEAAPFNLERDKILFIRLVMKIN